MQLSEGGAILSLLTGWHCMYSLLEEAIRDMEWLLLVA
jgi:hypothetical protein